MNVLECLQDFIKGQGHFCLESLFMDVVFLSVSEQNDWRNPDASVQLFVLWINPPGGPEAKISKAHADPMFIPLSVHCQVPIRHTSHRGVDIAA